MQREQTTATYGHGAPEQRGTLVKLGLVVQGQA